MKIVLIDDYISRTAVQELSGETVNTLFSVKGKTDHQANGAYALRSHGTICASILASVMPRHVELHTISTHNKDSTITLENVCTALGWCLKGPPDYICMSLGSSNWLEVKKLGQITKQLADAGSRIFAACANNGHVVFPAAYSWVTGIRYESGIIGLYQERDSPIGNNIIVGDFTTPVLEKLERENVFFMSRTNSMAAPYALGKMLSEGLILPAIRQNGYYALMPVETSQRALTPDDYLRAATIVARCRNDRLPYVLGFLEKGGWDVPKIEKPDFKRTPIAIVVNRTLEETGLSLRKLAKLTGLCPTTLCHYRNGQREPQGKNYDHVVNVLNGVIPTYKEEIE